MADIKMRRVIALGFFDGVHLGHAELIKRTKEVAIAGETYPSVLSFDTHPDMLVKGVNVQLINNAAARTEILKRLFGIDDVVYLHFNESMRRMPWREFVEIIIEEIGAAHIVVGHDFRFGYKGEGTAKLLLGYCAERGVGCDIIPEVKLDGITVSSTYIRELIRDGNIECANRFLGHPHVLVDTVRYGYKFGRTIGVPTINMRFPDGVLIPKHGVYATKVYLEDGEHIAVTNIGVRPTVGGQDSVSVESFILDFEGNLYGRQVKVEFFCFLRAEMKFDGVESLKAQILTDAEMTRAFFEEFFGADRGYIR
jgi:riboflavin kinase/FMN adenylyltransferase